jgi:hypothetical protein
MLARRMILWGKVSGMLHEAVEKWLMRCRCDGVFESEDGGSAGEVFGEGEDLKMVSVAMETVYSQVKFVFLVVLVHCRVLCRSLDIRRLHSRTMPHCTDAS